MYLKMKCYLLLLAILWSGVLVEGFINKVEPYKEITAIEAIKNHNDTQILHEREKAGKMSLSEKELEAGELLSFYQGEMVKSLYGENFYCFYGYTDKIKNYVLSEGEKINLNLVITYNEEENVTHIIWACPFLNEPF